VLSGCDTALGKEISGEGLIGLTRGFLQAGAKGVIASLWPQSDSATAEFMGRFYRHLERDGMGAAAALRAAQTEEWRSGQTSSASYWAGFEFHGDWI
jgi:CHAT domain-containing protein